MRIYVSHSRSFDYENELYAPIRAHFSRGTHEFILPHENGSDKDLKTVLSTCDLVLAEVSFPATGVGIELGRAEAAGIRIVCVYRTGSTPSSSIRRITDDIQEYDSTEALLLVLRDIVRNYEALDDPFQRVLFAAVREAGRIAMEKLGSFGSVGVKGMNDYVTSADTEAEEAIKRIVHSTFPDHGFIGEEGGETQRSSEYSWIVDPISSTVNYIHSLPHFGVSLALLKNGERMLAAVYDPFFGELFHAKKDNGAYLGNTRLSVTGISSLADALILVGINQKGGAEIDRGLAYFRRIMETNATPRRIGSVALQTAYVACGRAEAHIHDSNDPFALYAGKLILEEAGGKMTDFEGKPWTYHSKTLLATNGHSHGALIDILSQ
ncbi:MAG: inositol monophosphatase [Candidatus Moranbacteria bacterium]|nr:inositol monophosphatase [Candidatus Moranbacteria bacterium]